MPALVELGNDVYVPFRYRAAFDERAELHQYRAAVHFVVEEELLSRASLAVLVRRPADNDALARQAVLIRRPPQLVIEKPLAATPQAAMALENVLARAGVRHATPYLLVHCDWAHEWKQKTTAQGGAAMTIDWRFNSPEVNRCWKANPEDGGGPLNYYFIHLIALAGFLLGDYCVTECWADEEDTRRKMGMVAINGSNRFTATFCTGAANSAFSAAIDGVATIAAATPFGDVPRRGERDPRIDFLKRFYTSEVFRNAADQVAKERDRQTLKSWSELAVRLRNEKKI